MRKIVSFGMLGLLAACGSGGGEGGGSVTPPPPQVPTLTVTLTPSATSQTATEVDSSASLTVRADYSGTTSDPIYADVGYDKAVLTLDGPIMLSGNSYTVKFKAPSNLAAKNYSQLITFRLCRDSGCAVIYPGSSQSFTYTLDVKLSDWTTRQRNAAHNGYVHAEFDPAKFAKAWEFGDTASSFEPVAARQGTVFATMKDTSGARSVVALDGVTGIPRWRYSIGNIHSASGPTIAGGQLAISSMTSSSPDNPVVVLNADSGTFVRNMVFPAQWSTFAQPTFHQGGLYIAAGYYGNVVYGFDMASGARSWEANGSAGHTWDGQAPAVDDRYVYYYSGNLDVFDRLTGARVKTIGDPFWVWNGYSYGGTPMLGSANHVIAYSGNGQGTYPVSFPLVDYDVEAGANRWRTASLYSVIPAVAKGVVYAASNQTQQFDAIEEATGKVLWSWRPPTGETFNGNVIVTDTLALISTGNAIYAIALGGTHDTKWTANTPGWLAITPDAKLVVSPFVDAAGAKLTAYSLR